MTKLTRDLNYFCQKNVNEYKEKKEPDVSSLSPRASAAAAARTAATRK